MGKGLSLVLISEINGEQPVKGEYLIIENQYRAAKNGTHFLAMKIGDKSGELAVKVWDATEELFTLLEVGKVIEIQNIVPKIFKDQIQLEWDGRNQNAFRIIPDAEIDYSQFLPQTPGSLTTYWNSLVKIMESIQEPILKKVLNYFFEDKTFVTHFLRVPAALKRHHAYIGGLVEHTAGVIALCKAAAGYYPLINRDLLLAGAILHDIGKVKTYKINKGFEGTNEGKLIGHLVLGVQMVEQAFQSAFSEIEPSEKNQSIHEQLIHLLVSHHGIMEWGSPIEPLTIEACILHHADNMDAQVNKFLTIMRDNQIKTEWAPFDPGLGRSIYINPLLPNISSQTKQEEVG